MFSEKFIKRELERKITEGAKSFAIFPFGENGRRVRDCLEAYYGIDAAWIIDNNLYRFNRAIISLESFLKENDRSDVIIILTTENRTLNKRLYDHLIDCCPPENILNLLSLRDGNNREITDQFSIEKIFGSSKLDGSKVKNSTNINNETSVIKIRFLYTVYAHWNSIHSIIESFTDDKRFDVLIILGYQKSVDSKNKRISNMKKLGYNYVAWDEYDSEIDKPDILVISHLWDETNLNNCRKHTKLIISASMSLVLYGNSVDAFVNLSSIGDRLFKPDYYLFDGYVYDKVKDTPFFKGRVKRVGNAKFDGIYQACSARRIPENWEKIKDKKIILWASDHGITEEMPHRIRDELSFDIYARSIFSFFRENDEMALIFRPHPQFFVELIEYGIWTNDDLNCFRRIIDETTNVILDETDNYDVAYSVSDGIITDCMCGVLCSALPMMKPIGVLFRKDKKIGSCAPELVNEYASIDSEERLYEFFYEIKDGIDNTYQKRKALFDKYIESFDGNNGKRIKELIERLYNEKNS